MLIIDELKLELDSNNINVMNAIKVLVIDIWQLICVSLYFLFYMILYKNPTIMIN